MTPDELRKKAAAEEEAARESFERCDTDGFLSQWAHGVMAEKLRLEAFLAEAGGVWEFPALFDLEGKRVPAKLMTVADRFRGYGTRTVWMVVDPATRKATAWVTPLTPGSKRSERRLEALGYRESVERAPAKVVLAGESVNVHAHVVRADDGFGGA